MRTVRQHLVVVPGLREPLTVGEIFRRGAKSRQFWSRVKMTEVAIAPAAPAPAAAPAAAQTSYQITITELRSQRDAIDQAIAILEALS